MTDMQLARHVGERLRQTRLSLHQKQAVIAGLAGISTDYLYQVERGKKVPTLPVLVALARALRVPIDRLIGDGQVADPSPARREGEFYRALTCPPPVELLPLDSLHRQVRDVWRLWQTSPTRYSSLKAQLPALIAQVERRPSSSDERAGVTFACAGDLYGLVRSYAKRTGRLDLSLLAADRGIRAAEQLDDPVRLATTQWNMAHVLLADHQPEGAEEVAMRSAEALTPQSHSDPTMALQGSLLLVGAIAASRRGDHWTARSRVEQALRLAGRTGDCKRRLDGVRPHECRHASRLHRGRSRRGC